MSAVVITNGDGIMSDTYFLFHSFFYEFFTKYNVFVKKGGVEPKNLSYFEW